VGEVLPDCLRLAVQQPLGELELVERLVPELLAAQDALADPGQRRRQDHPVHRMWRRRGDRARDAAADVVAHEHRLLKAQLADQAQDARRLGLGRVRLLGRAVMAVRLPEAAQVRDHDVGVVGE
jgi:hypothetical protein